jgi:hypothetical protein
MGSSCHVFEFQFCLRLIKRSRQVRNVIGDLQCGEYLAVASGAGERKHYLLSSFGWGGPGDCQHGPAETDVSFGFFYVAPCNLAQVTPRLRSIFKRIAGAHVQHAQTVWEALEALYDMQENHKGMTGSAIATMMEAFTALVHDAFAPMPKPDGLPSSSSSLSMVYNNFVDIANDHMEEAAKFLKVFGPCSSGWGRALTLSHSVLHQFTFAHPSYFCAVVLLFIRPSWRIKLNLTPIAMSSTVGRLRGLGGWRLRFRFYGLFVLGWFDRFAAFVSSTASRHQNHTMLVHDVSNLELRLWVVCL